MDIELIEKFSSPAIVALCLCVGYIIRNAIGAEAVNRYIPLICGAVGVAAAIVMNFAAGIGTDNIVQIVVAGLVSGLASTGCYEAAKNLKGGQDGE